MTIRTRLVVTVVVLLAGALAVSSFVQLRAAERALRTQVDDRLLDEFRNFMDAHPPAGAPPATPPSPARAPQLPSETVFADGKQFATFTITADGTRREVDRAGTREHPRALPQVRPGDDRAVQPGAPPTIFTAPATDGSLRYRVVTAAQPDGAVAVVAVSLERTDAALDHLRTVALLTAVVTILLLGGLGALLVRRRLRPLEHVAETAQRIADGELDERVRIESPDDEVAAVGRSFNRMVDSLQTSLAGQRAVEARLRQFIADASHELRTPLTTVQGYVELYAAGALPTEATRDRAMDRIGAEATRMADLVQQLLVLALLDQELPLASEPVAVNELVAEVVGDTRVAHPDRQIVLDVSTDSGATVMGDTAALRQVVLNLTQNALRHTPANTPVELRVDAHDTGVRIECVDHGPGIPEAARAKVFDRFYRADKARSREMGGAGLGLAIAASIVTRHDGRITCTETPGGGATFVVELPAAPVRDRGELASSVGAAS